MQEHDTQHTQEDYFVIFSKVKGIDLPDNMTESYWTMEDIFYEDYKEEIACYEQDFKPEGFDFQFYLEEIVPIYFAECEGDCCSCVSCNPGDYYEMHEELSRL